MDTWLQFDRFTLDLTRAALRFDDQEIFLRPKALGVLRHLAENAGRLVGKQELFEIIWPDVVVTDDVLVQCIRELRHILGDKERRVIKTVARRGYLLDTEVTISVPNSLPAVKGLKPNDTSAAATPQHAVSLDFTPAPLPLSARSELFSEQDARRVAEIAQQKLLPVPRIQIATPDDDVPLAVRRFVGVWVSTKGFVGTGRQFMFVVTHVEREGLAGGYTVRGPPAPNSRIQNPAEAVAFTAYIARRVLAYSNPRGSYRVWFGSGNSLIFQQTYVSGYMTMVALEPIWTLLEAERGRNASLETVVAPEEFRAVKSPAR